MSMQIEYTIQASFLVLSKGVLQWWPRELFASDTISDNFINKLSDAIRYLIIDMKISEIDIILQGSGILWFYNLYFRWNSHLYKWFCWSGLSSNKSENHIKTYFGSEGRDIKSAQQDHNYSQITTFIDCILRKLDDMIISFNCSQCSRRYERGWFSRYEISWEYSAMSAAYYTFS